jgi:menaquinone-specific isochorismate synthase
MTILPLEAAGSRTPAALRDFLAQCQAAARRAGRPQLVSISLEVDALDPLAVLESIFEPGEPHFYVERPAEGVAMAGAEAAAVFTATGPDRFAASRHFIEETLAHAVAVGDLSAPFSGPHFFAAFAFSDQTEPGEPFPAATIWVPRWQVAHAGGRTVAVANLSVDETSSVDLLTEKVWRAHAKFRAFDYAAPEFQGPGVSPRAQVSEVGASGGYARSVARALEGIAGRAFEKIVLARAKDLAAKETLHPLRVLNGLRQRFSGCYAFSVANGRGQSFIGASPERLLRVEGGRLLTEALAGSAPRGATASEDAVLAAALLRDDKERREHSLVLDFIVERLGSLGLRPEASDRPGIRQFANVQHLHTPVRAALPAEVRLLDVLAALYPTPAVGGSPRDAAVGRIRELEGFPRGLYAGALGWLDARGGGEFFAGLRSALIDGNRARLFAGAGIVAGSSPEKELAETEMKFKAMEEALLS